jgi:membrane protein DedA with SNARE-associated domain
VEAWFEQYRYIALSVGTFFEGETAILLASSLIYKGLFSPVYTVLFGFLGSFISDWIYYLIGRINGKLFIERRPKLQKNLEPVTRYFSKNKTQILMSYRFLYGFRVIIPLIIGLSRVSMSVFLFYSVISGLLWATTVSTIGYFAGKTFNISAQSIQENLFFVIAGFAGFGLLLGFIIRKITAQRMAINEQQPHS